MDNVLSEMKSDITNTGANQTETTGHSHDKGTATIMEVLNTDRYTYLNVADQNAHNFWMAIPKEAVIVGDKITFEGGLLKNKFESKEFNRIFETLYLVSRFTLTSADGTPKELSSDDTTNDGQAEGTKKAAKPFSATPAIVDLIDNASIYDGKSVTLSGKVVKVNFNIMGKNWVHLVNDDSPGKDFLITTNEKVMEGQQVKFNGTITLNKDFGAGYKYDIIMEDAVLK